VAWRNGLLGKSPDSVCMGSELESYDDDSPLFTDRPLFEDQFFNWTVVYLETVLFYLRTSCF